MKAKDFNEKFLESYRNEQSDPTDKGHNFDSIPAADGDQVINPAAPVVPSPIVTGAQAANQSLDLTAFGYPLADFTNALLPNGAPVGSRHKSALQLAYNLLIMCDGSKEKVLAMLMQLQWVKDIVAERGQKELDDIMDAAQKLKHKRESEQINDLMPTKEMIRAIEQVTGKKYSALIREMHKRVVAALGEDDEDNIIQLLERIGMEIEKLFREFPLIRLLCHRVKRKHYIAALLVGAAFCMTLCTRMWYKFWPAPGRKCRLNSLLALIGRMGSGKHIAVDLYQILMEPVKMADKAQVDALNKWNLEREQNSGASKNKTRRPNGIMRALPPETSAAGAREAEFNAHEEIDGVDTYLHVSQFDSELDNTLRQLKKAYMDALFTLWLKSYHNEPHGSLLKSSSAPVGEYPVHYNAVYTGTGDALRKLATSNNFVNGLLSRFTFVPMGDSNFEMLENHEYDEADRQNEEALRDWAYKLDMTKGEIPCKPVSDALHQWTKRRMDDAREDHDYAEEDLIKRPCWHGINFALPFIVSRHWDQMEQDADGRYKCGPDFKTDKYDIQLALLIAKAQLAFQEHYAKAIGEQHYDNLQTEQASNTRHKNKSWLGFHRLPDVFTSEDVDRCFGYQGKQGSICSKLKRLQDDGMAQKIRSGADKGKYRKLM
jgi:hypothetical protein